MSREVVVGMSGGVDSSVVTWLLRQQGYDIIGVTMQIWQNGDMDVQETEGGYCGLSAVGNAHRVAVDLGIPYYAMSFREEFRKNVMDYFVGEYVEGKAPSPCITCNRYVRWESFLRRNMAVGADCVATGHCTQIGQLPDGRYALKTSVTVKKGQTYTLYDLAQDQLTHTLVPMGSFCKDEIRGMARDIGLQVAHKPDSQEICFIPDHDYTNLIEKYTGRQIPKGNFVDPQGNVLGRHEGISRYTIDQRKGLNLSMRRPVFVVEIRPEANEVVIGEGKNVFTNALCYSKLNWVAVDGPHGQVMEVIVRIRYSRRGAPCTIREIDPDLVKCVFHELIRAATPGQTVAFCQRGHVAGGGTII